MIAGSVAFKSFVIIAHIGHTASSVLHEVHATTTSFKVLRLRSSDSSSALKGDHRNESSNCPAARELSSIARKSWERKGVAVFLCLSPAEPGSA